MKKTAIILTLILGIIAVGVVWRVHRASSPQQVDAAEFESDMTEALLRGILPELQDAPVCFVAFGEGKTAPSWPFIARFAGSHPSVESFKSSVHPPGGKVFEISTGRTGVIVQIISLKEYVPGTFDVLVAFSNLPSGRDRFVYRISGTGGDWTIKSRKPE
ncbi:MAG: hypothetical protein WAO21_08085 [Verrucomicrobiia bacterium]